VVWGGTSPSTLTEHTHRHQTAVFRSGETCPEAGSKRALPSNKSGAFPPETGLPLNNVRVHRRSRHKQPYSEQPRFRRTLNRRTATAYAGFPGGKAQRSCAFAPGNPGLGPRSLHPKPHTMMPAPGEKSEAAKLMEMVQKDADGSRLASPRAIQSALASQNPTKSLIRGLGVSVWKWFPESVSLAFLCCRHDNSTSFRQQGEQKLVLVEFLWPDSHMKQQNAPLLARR